MHQQSVTLVVRASHSQIPLLCWILLFVLLVSIVVSITVIFCFCVKTQCRNQKRKERSRVASHINGFSSTHNYNLTEMLPKYASTPVQSYSTQKLYQWCQQKEMQQYKSLWAVNPSSGKSNLTIKLWPNFTFLYQNKNLEKFLVLVPSSAIVHISEKTDNSNTYKTRSLPSKHKQRPVSSIEDLDELYSKVNFSKKLRNRMTNDEAAIIAFCRSKSQNLSQFTGSGPKGDDAMVIYDERTAL